MERACSRVHLEARMSSTRDRAGSAGVCTGVGVVLACKTAPRANLHKSEVVQLASHFTPDPRFEIAQPVRAADQIRS